MLDLTWNIFSRTGNVETYLLLKEIEREYQEPADNDQETLAEINSSLT